MPAPRVTRKFVVDVVGVLCLAAAPLWLYLLLFPEGYAYTGGIFVLLAALVVNIGGIVHVSREDAELRHIMMVGLFVKLMGAAAYLTLMLHYYHGGDLFQYFRWGDEIARNIKEYGEIGGLRGEFAFTSNGAWNGSVVLIVITGALFSIIGSSLSGAIVIFSSFAYWGSCLFWGAFTRAFPKSDRYLAATLLFFMPSLVFWSATLGKDALMYFFIGLVTYGLCQALYGARSRAILMIAVGVLGVAVIRAHIASILALTLCAVFLISKNRSGMGGVLSRIALIPLLVIGSFYTTNSAREKLGISESHSAEQVASNWSNVTQYGGSSFESGSLTKRLVMAPFLPFRPFPWEVSSIQTLLASTEGTFLLLMLWVNRKGLKLSLRQWRSDPFITFILLFSLETSAALSSAFSNFGLLARERVMFTPLLILLIPAYTQLRSGRELHHAIPARRTTIELLSSR